MDFLLFQVYIGALIPTSLTDQTNITNGNTVYDILCWYNKNKHICTHNTPNV